MTDTTRSNLISSLVALIFVLTAFSMVADEPARKVVDVRVTMTASEYAQALDRARQQGEDDMRKRVRACNLGDTFTLDLPIKKGPM